MKKFEKAPTDENIMKAMYKDELGRNEILGYFIQLLNALDTNYSLALDGAWGKWQDLLRETGNSHTEGL